MTVSQEMSHVETGTIDQTPNYGTTFADRVPTDH